LSPVHSYIARNLAKVGENEIAINHEGRSAFQASGSDVFATP